MKTLKTQQLKTVNGGEAGQITLASKEQSGSFKAGPIPLPINVKDPRASMPTPLAF